MAECTVASNSAPELPLVVVTKVASMLQRNETEGSAFQDLLQLAAVSLQLRQAVLSSMQQMKRRHMKIVINQDCANVAGIVVTNELRSSYSQMDCIGALLAFAQPNSLDLSEYENNLGRSLILVRSLPLPVTRLFLDLNVDEIGVDSPLDQVLKAVASKTNLETLSFSVDCYDKSALALYKKASPSVPKDSPFNHLLTLKNLRTLYFNTNTLYNRFVWPAQIADLLNRWHSKITHFCCRVYHPRERVKLFQGMSDVVRGNIVSVCCIYLSSFRAAEELWFLGCLPNCTTIDLISIYGSSVTRQTFDDLGGRLLDFCCSDNVHQGRTLKCSFECRCDSDVQQYVEEGGETQMEYTRDDTVVRLSIGPELMGHKHCPFKNNPHDNL